MKQISRKICMLGNFAVGKSSLVRRYVNGVFDASYQTTVGVKIDTVHTQVNDTQVKLLLWDLAGAAALTAQSRAYIHGMQAYVLVADGTRQETVADAEQIHHEIVHEVGALPFVCLLNKHDLSDWVIADEWLQQHRAQGWMIYPSSALNGEGVIQAFSALAQATLAQPVRETSL